MTRAQERVTEARSAVNEWLTHSADNLCEALLHLYDQQERDEKREGEAKHRNGRGFNKLDARCLTPKAKDAKERGYLTPKELMFLCKPNKRGECKLAKYWRQLEFMLKLTSALEAEREARKRRPQSEKTLRSKKDRAA